MKTIIELITDEIKNVFTECGYDEAYAKVTVSNRPDLCEFQCNGAMLSLDLSILIYVRIIWLDILMRCLKQRSLDILMLIRKRLLL